MPNQNDIEQWKQTIRSRYENYLKTSFYFKDDNLRESFHQALAEYDLMKGPFPEVAYGFEQGINAWDLAKEIFIQDSDRLLPALRNDPLYDHQERAIRAVNSDQNIIVATGTASGKTESFLYPILFELYRQHLAGQLNEPGVRALILYPMNALANDQRRRLEEICRDLDNANSDFKPTFGQYIGETPERGIAHAEEDRLANELLSRKEMRENPPHILLTNYSMLEYLLIRPSDSELFDSGRGKHWRFIVLDEAHQYRGTRGMEMGMLVRRLKQRLRAGGREDLFSCIATSATISTGEGEEDKQAVASFAEALFGEKFFADNVIFGRSRQTKNENPRRFHLFMSALEGAFLTHNKGKDIIALNRKSVMEGEELEAVPLEIALCRECGQHYYVGREKNGVLQEAIRDPSHHEFGVDYYLPLDNDVETSSILRLCRQCGKLSAQNTGCECNADIAVQKCDSHDERPDQIKKCEVCGYQRGGIGDPVQEIVHGSDGPNSVIATALHGLLPEGRRKILSFTDSRQEAAFFAWYAEDSYSKIRDRNFILRALKAETVDNEGLSVADLQNRLKKQWEVAGLFNESDSSEAKNREMLKIIYREALTDEKRISLEGVGLAKWFVKIPNSLQPPEEMLDEPWHFTKREAQELLVYLLDDLRTKKVIDFSHHDGALNWDDVSPWQSSRQPAVCQGNVTRRAATRSWDSRRSAVIKHFLFRLLGPDSDLSVDEKLEAGEKLMNVVWKVLRERDISTVDDADKILVRAKQNGAFRLNSRWLRIKLLTSEEIYECDTCASLSVYNIRRVCPRNRCPGQLIHVNKEKLEQNHYRVLYKDSNLPPTLSAEEHTAQVQSKEARNRQERFKSGSINLLSSSTTFEIGVDLGDLEVVFLRNVPPEPFNYTQRVGRAGRREGMSGLALTYCRRNPHDLYHYAAPEERVMQGKINPPHLKLMNRKIILRHITAVALSAFFKKKDNVGRFWNVKDLIGDWDNPRAVADFEDFCRNNDELYESIRLVVPPNMHTETGLNNRKWVEEIAGSESRFAYAEQEICDDYCKMRKMREEYFHKGDDRHVGQIGRRMDTIAEERTLTFLSRKAIIPKYGFPVDVVELDTRPKSSADAAKVSLQRDLQQAIAEYAAGCKVVANKKEWTSHGVKKIPGKEFRVMCYEYDDARNFKQCHENNSSFQRKYLCPEFGFVTSLLDQPKEPHGRAHRLYTTRPFFRGFDKDVQLENLSKDLFGIRITQALQGGLVVLCEGKKGNGFYICRSCGAHDTERDFPHKTPEGSDCNEMPEQFSLGHEFVTDVVRLQFPGLTDQWEAYSLAYAVLLGAAEALDVPDADLNVTITGDDTTDNAAIVLYDNVPGGAGLVAHLDDEKTFLEMLRNTKTRVEGGCGCDESCYGCLRGYRNQFAHPHLRRTAALKFLSTALKRAGSVS